MKFFYILAVGSLATLFIGDADSETHAHIRDATFLIIMLLVFAVSAITHRFERAVREIKEPNFDIAAGNRKERLELGQLFLSVVSMFALGTAAQGAFRCVSSGNALSASCVWNGIWKQGDDDLG